MCAGGTECPRSGTVVNLFGEPRKRREVGESVLLHGQLCRLSDVLLRRGSLSKGGADEQLNVCIGPIEPCRMVGEDMKGGWETIRGGGAERGRCLCALPNLVNGCEGSSGETNAFL